MIANTAKEKRRSPVDIASFPEFVGLESLYVFRLPALGTLGYVKLHRLALLQALETARLDC
jgi:hypothetical protein